MRHQQACLGREGLELLDHGEPARVGEVPDPACSAQVGGVAPPAKEITDRAGVGVGTLYRHFPQRSDLVKAVVESGIDAVAEAGPALAATFPPAEALTRWIDRFTQLLATKRGLAAA